MKSADWVHAGGRFGAANLATHLRGPTSRGRARRTARARAMRRFSRLHPYWYDSRFDEPFVSRLPQDLLEARQAEALAREWSRQFRYKEERQRERDVRQLIPVAESFLALLADAEGRSAARASSPAAPSRPPGGGASEGQGVGRNRSEPARRPTGAPSFGYAPERIEKHLRDTWGRHVVRSVAWALFRLRVRLRAPGVDRASWSPGTVGAPRRRHERADENPPAAPAPPAASAAPEGARRP